MKKVLFSLLVCAASMTAMAAVSASATLKITSGDGYYSDLTIEEGATSTQYATLYEDGGVTIALYAKYDSKKCEVLSINGKLGALPIGFKATQSTTYTITCTEASGDALYIKNGSAEPVKITTALNLAVTITDAQKDTYVEDVLALVEPYIRTVTAGQWGTICYPKAITSVTGGTLYNLTNATATVVNAEEVTSFPTTAGKAYVFKADAEATELVMANTGDDATLQTTHGLVGTFEDTTTPEGAWGIMGDYVVKVKAGNALLANRAYINMEDLTSPSAPKRGRAIFMISNTPTGMELIDAETAKDGKMMIDGQLIIIKGGKMFNAQGAQL